MGDFRITIEAIGGHGCSRKTPSGQQVYGCDQASCPDCQARWFVEQLKARGTHVVSAKLEHWPVPGAAGCTRTEGPGPVDDILTLTGVRTGEFDDAKPKQAGFAQLGLMVAMAMLVTMLAILWPDVARGDDAGAQPEGMSLKLSAGGEVLVGGDASTVITPRARLEVSAPIPIFSSTAQDAKGNAYDRSWRWPQLEVTTDFTGLPGQTAAVNPEAFDTWRSLETAIGLVVPAFQSATQRVSFGIEGGFATKIPGHTEPRNKTARWGQVLAEIAQTKGAAYLRIGLGGDQRLDGDYRLVTIVEGAVRLRSGDAQGLARDVEVRLVGDAILGLSVAGFVPSSRDVVRIAIVASR